MEIKTITVGPLGANCFIVADEKTSEAIIIDPGDEPEKILETVNNNNYKIKYIICTHAHFDHVGATGEIKRNTNAKIVIHKNDLELYRNAVDQGAFWGFEVESLPEPDMFVDEGEKIEFGSLSFEVMHMPGHSPGGICLYGENVLFAGDTLFAGSVGRTDFTGGDLSLLKKSFARLLTLPPETKVFSGHGPSTTIGIEKINNFFVDEI
ncbi:MAG: MBL fold metallo-hydrolase [Nitrospiraceae bacterium]|nr:MBL fold metallo-hydrolase [Nitrospiraceae bacterium]